RARFRWRKLCASPVKVGEIIELLLSCQIDRRGLHEVLSGRLMVALRVSLRLRLHDRRIDAKNRLLRRKIGYRWLISWRWLVEVCKAEVLAKATEVTSEITLAKTTKTAGGTKICTWCSSKIRGCTKRGSTEIAKVPTRRPFWTGRCSFRTS